MHIVKRHESGGEGDTLRPLPGNARPRRRLPAWLIGALAGAAVVGVGTAVEYGLRGRQGPPPVVLVAPVTRGLVGSSVQASGALVPVETTVVSQPIAGRVAQVLVGAGDAVQAGQALARFDPLALRAELARARARLVAAGVAVFEAEVLHERTSAALQTPKDPSDLDELEAADVVAEARLARAEAEVDARQAAYRVAEQQLGQRTVRAPANGVVISREIEPGQSVAVGAVLFTIASALTHLRLIAEVPEADMAGIDRDQRAQFTVPAFRGRWFEARVMAMGSLRGPEGARRFPVTLALDNQDRALSPGMSATVRIVTASSGPVFRVPLAALDFAPPTLSALRDEPAVWRVDGTGTALTRLPVEVGHSDGRYAEIRAPGLREGAAVAVGLARLQDRHPDERRSP